MLFKMKTLGNEKLIPKSECKDRIKSKKRLKTQTVIPGRPEMTENDRKQIFFLSHLMCFKQSSRSRLPFPDKPYLFRMVCCQDSYNQ